MYLTKRIYVKNWDHTAPEERTLITVTKDEKPLDGVNVSNISYLIEDVGYWRKFNALHKWFVDNVQKGEDDCEEYYVSIDSIKKILSILKVIDNDNSKAEELLPSQEGFFFGTVEYDEWYFNDVKRSIEIFENILSDKEKNIISTDYYYRSSW